MAVAPEPLPPLLSVIVTVGVAVYELPDSSSVMLLRAPLTPFTVPTVALAVAF